MPCVLLGVCGHEAVSEQVPRLVARLLEFAQVKVVCTPSVEDFAPSLIHQLETAHGIVRPWPTHARCDSSSTTPPQRLVDGSIGFLTMVKNRVESSTSSWDDAVDEQSLPQSAAAAGKAARGRMRARAWHVVHVAALGGEARRHDVGAREDEADGASVHLVLG